MNGMLYLLRKGIGVGPQSTGIRNGREFEEGNAWRECDMLGSLAALATKLMTVVSHKTV